MVNLNPNIGSILPKGGPEYTGAAKNSSTSSKSGFADTIKAIGKNLSKVDDLQQSADKSVIDMLSGKGDITSVVSQVAKADMSFKLLVGVRNKLIEAYKQTMNMPV